MDQGSTGRGRGWSLESALGQGRLDLLRGGTGGPGADVVAAPSSLPSVERTLGGFAQVLALVAENVGRALPVVADGARGQQRSDWDRRSKLEVKLPRVAGDANRLIVLEIDELDS